MRLAVANHWRLESLTKSGCTIADIATWNSSLRRTYTECARWRSLILKRIKAERPALVIASVSRGGRLVIGGRTVPIKGHEATYRAALARTLVRLEARARDVVLLGMTPLSRVDPPVCLAAHRRDARACATPVSKAVSASFRSLEIAAAARAGSRWIDPTGWICKAGTCPAIVGRFLVYRNASHLTARFAAVMRSRLDSALGTIR